MSASIGGVNQLVNVIRSELTARAPKAGAGQRAAAGKTDARRTERDLTSLIGVRIRQIGRDDPQRGRKAFRVFLEAVLLSQFGDQMMADPKFYQMLDEVQHAMEADAACAAMVAEAIDKLLADEA